jgi:hypothetical protein
MKKKLLLFLPAFLTAAVVLAQPNSQVDVTNYRGAFAPAPTAQWTDGWTNFNPQTTNYGTSNVNVTADISTNTTWTSNNVYLLQGPISVLSGATLTIQPGTIIMGDKNSTRSSLLVNRGGKIIAAGTLCRPIVFTSNQAAGSRAPGDWAGLLLLGSAPNNISLEQPIEGIPASGTKYNHGGTNNQDSSGVLQYVRIEYSGQIFSANNEINGLTLGSVGNKTVIDHIQVSFNGDDSFEWFGGSVSAKYLVSYKTVDDDFDTDLGFSGLLQHLLVVRDPAVADGSESNGIESDNNNISPRTQTPKTRGSIYNLTQIGGFQPGASTNALHFRGAHLRRNTDQKVFNSIFMNNKNGLHVQDATTLANVGEDSLIYRNNIIAANFTANPTHVAFFDANTRNLFDVNAGSVYGVDSVDMGSNGINANLLTDPYSSTFNYDWRPNPAVTTNPATDATSISGVTDLGLSFSLLGNLFDPNQEKDFTADLFSVAGGTSNGEIIINIALLSGFQVGVKNIATLTSTPVVGTAVAGFENDKFTFETDGNSIIIKSIAGYKLNKGDFKSIALTAKRPATGTSAYTIQTLSGSISGGGDTSTGNNSGAQAFSAN